jgi:hypothetical protein
VMNHFSVKTTVIWVESHIFYNLNIDPRSQSYDCWIYNYNTAVAVIYNGFNVETNTILTTITDTIVG